MEYIDALIGTTDNVERDQRMATALTALEASTGGKARLPLVPYWSGF